MHLVNQHLFNVVERCITLLSHDLASLVLPHDHFVLILMPMAIAVEALAEVWSNTVIDSYLILASYVNLSFTSQTFSYIDKSWRDHYVVQQQYTLQKIRYDRYNISNKHISSSNLKYTIEQHHDISNILDIIKNNDDSKFQTYIIWLSGAIACIEKENLIILTIRNHNGDLLATSCIQIFDIDFSTHHKSNKIQIFFRWLEWFHIVPSFWRIQIGIIWIPPFYQFSGIYYHVHVNENESNEIIDTIQKYIFQLHPNVPIILHIKEPGDKSKNIILNNDREFILPWFRTIKAIFPSNIDSLDTYINLLCRHARKRNLRIYKKQFEEGGGKIRYLYPSSKVDFDEIQMRMKELTQLKLETDARYPLNKYTGSDKFSNEWMSSMMLINKLLNNNQIIFIFAEENWNENLLGFALLFIHSSINQIIFKTIGLHDNVHTRQLRVYQNLFLATIDWSLRNGHNVIDFGAGHEKTKALLLEKQIRSCDDEHTHASIKGILKSGNPFYKFIINHISNPAKQQNK
ncbi:unnamed protein product [Rotaria sordida]|uniref:Uncharacterized protein n=1 Tax=Rotaria sordida TaxID=392033 RepID=A0A815CD39_9BILA|nr:unnamed protein product [Rotaria sordida]